MQLLPTRRTNAERRQETRAALIAAARALFITRGYAETGTPDIVTAANVTRGALYHHFADKAALMRAVVEGELAAVAEAIRQASPEGLSLQQAFRGGARAYLDAMAEPGRARLLLLEGPAVLGMQEMACLDKEQGEATLREAIAAIPGITGLPEDERHALAAMLGAAFERAALAIAGGAERDAYLDALERLYCGLCKP